MYDERYAALFEPLRVGTVTLRNRFTTLPIGMHGFNNVDGTPTPQMVEAYRRRAKGGAAMVSIHLTMADNRELSSRGELIFADPRAVPAFALLARAIHEEGAVAAIQIANCWHTDFPYRMSQVPTAEIQHIIDLYARAAGRIVDAGFDFITIQGANGWPVHRFMSGAYNDRLDRFSDPTLLPSLIIRAIRREVGKALNISIRMAYDDNSGPDRHHAGEGSDPVRAGLRGCRPRSSRPCPRPRADRARREILRRADLRERGGSAFTLRRHPGAYQRAGAGARPRDKS